MNKIKWLFAMMMVVAMFAMTSCDPALGGKGDGGNGDVPSAKTFTVKFDTNGGTPATYADQKVAENGVLSPYNIPTKAGNVFKGWFDGETAYTRTSKITKDVTLVAKWAMPVVSFDMNGSTSADVADVEVAKDATLADKFPADPTGGSGTFQGWYGNGVKYTKDTVITEDVTLVAVWDGVKKTITFDVNGGTGSMTAQDIVVGTKAALTANTLTREDYDFVGWATTASGAVEYADQAEFVANDTTAVTLYAVWKAGLVFTEITSEASPYYGTYNVKPGKAPLVGKLEIPAEYKGKPVAIVMGFTNKTEITSVTIPSSVKYIPANTFTGCTSLESVTLEEGIGITEIPQNLFKDTKLKTFTVSNKITKIGASAFQNSALESISFEENSVLTEIGNSAFNGSKLANITIPETVTTIGVSVFSGTPLKTISISKDITTMSGALFGSNIETIDIDSENPYYEAVDGAVYEKETKTLSFVSLTKTGVFSVKEGTLVVNVPFANTKGLTGVTLPSTLTTIGLNAFKDTTFSEIIIPESVTTIGDNAFSGAKATSISIPSGVTSLGRSVFENSAITTLPTIPEDATFGGSFFENCLGLTEITWTYKYTNPNLGTYDGLYPFVSCKNLTKATIAKGVTKIPNGMFQNCTSLKNVILPSTLEKMGQNVFMSCEKLESITLSKEIKTIETNIVVSTKASLYVEPTSKLDDWQIMDYTAQDGPVYYWHAGAPVIWGCTLDADQEYVVSVVKGDSTIENASDEKTLNAPYREGYTFAGWSTTSGGSAEAGGADYLRTAANGTYYAVWTAK